LPGFFKNQKMKFTLFIIAIIAAGAFFFYNDAVKLVRIPFLTGSGTGRPPLTFKGGGKVIVNTPTKTDAA
jgi:hypothetical protein